MALKKISEYLRNGVNNFITSGVAGNLVNQFVDNGSNQSEYKTGPDIKKSPFEIPDSPHEKISKDPLGFQQIQYPADLGSMELGHYMLFFTLTNRMVSEDEATMDLEQSRRVGLETGASGNIIQTERGGPGKYSADYKMNMKTNLRDQYTRRGIPHGGAAVNQVSLDNTVLSEVPAGQIVTSAIALYMPPDVKVSYKASWDTEAAELAGDIAEVWKGMKTAGNAHAMLKEALKGGVGAATGFLKKAGGEVLQGFGGGDAFKLISKNMGIAINPRQEMYYEGPQFRQFQYSFKFWPRSEDEAKRVQNIIKLFKYHMHPITDEQYYGRMFRIPSEFEIHYLCKSGVNDKMNKISRCVLSDCDVTYNPDGNAKFFEKDSSPVSYQMDLTFKELEFMTKDKISLGY